MLLGLGGWFAYELWRTASELTAARRALDELSLESVERADGLRGVVDPVLSSIDAADEHANRPIFDLLRPLPLIGDQIDGLRDTTSVLSQLTDAAEDELNRVETALANSGSGPGRVAILETAIESVGRVRSAAAGIDAVDPDGLIGPLRAGVVEINAKLDELPDRLDEVETTLEQSLGVLRGPTRLLVLAANNAEARAGMGMHLSAGLIVIENGDFTTSPFVRTGSINQVERHVAPVPDELATLFRGQWGFGREWRTVGTTPNFPVVGEIFTDLATATPIGVPDAVISLDAPALSDLLEVTGAVEVDDLEISADTVVDQLLRDNYLELGDLEGNQRAQRYDLQGDIAQAIFDATTSRDIDLVPLAAALQRASESRNLLAYSADPALADLIEMLGAEGDLTPQSLLVAFQNASASKRDYYLQPEVDIVPIGEPSPHERRYRITGTLFNPDVNPTSDYVDNLYQGVPRTVHRTFVSFTLPGPATDIEILGGYSSRLGTDGPTNLATVWMRIPEEESRSVSVEFTIRNDVAAVNLVPSARVNPTFYRFGPTEVLDDVPRVVVLPSIGTLQPQTAKAGHAAALTVAGFGLLLVVARSRRIAAGADDHEIRVDTALAVAMFAIAAAIAAGVAIF